MHDDAALYGCDVVHTRTHQVLDLAEHCGRALGKKQMTMTFEQWLAATNGGAGRPATGRWRMPRYYHGASIGGLDGTYQNTADLNSTSPMAMRRSGSASRGRQPRPRHHHDAIAKCGVYRAAPGPIRSGSGQARAAHYRRWPFPGQFSIEVVDDGAGGLKPRVWSVNVSNEAVVYAGSNRYRAVGTACALLYVRRANGPRKSGA